jgi:hypothetical protein
MVVQRPILYALIMPMLLDAAAMDPVRGSGNVQVLRETTNDAEEPHAQNHLSTGEVQLSLSVSFLSVWL